MNSKLWFSRVLLGVALLAGAAVYWHALDGQWFYDDADYVLGDPRVDHLELFWPTHWSDPPPELNNDEETSRVLPGYEKPLIGERFLWHLSFALERKAFGVDARASHTVNLAIHLCCIVLLFFALSCLLRFYEKEHEPGGAALDKGWLFLPGLAALVFAIHPWAAEPVSYVSARNGSMGAACVLIGLICWLGMLAKVSKIELRILCGLGVLISTLAAYACKENFGVAPAGYVLVTLPVLWHRLGQRSRLPAVVAVCGGILLLSIAGYLGIRGSDRAHGLFEQVSVRGWTYLFEIQNPLMLMTLADQVPCLRLSLETNHPGWPELACWAGLLGNIAIFSLGLIGGIRRPLLLCVAWFYLILLPTNSFLPRPDFLAMRNMYLPVMGSAVLAAGILIWANIQLGHRRTALGTALRGALILGFAVLLMYWAGSTREWVEGYVDPVKIWDRSAEQAPDHAVVRLNLGYELINRGVDEQAKSWGERELKAALSAENTPTMRYHSDRSRSMRRMFALRMLGTGYRQAGNHALAEEYFARSWREQENLQVWLLWIETCAEGGFDNRLSVALDEGFRRWPNAWWPVVVRGIQHGKGMDRKTITAEVRADFSAADSAPDAILPDLRMLQIRVLSLLLLLEPDPAKVAERTERLIGLGISEKALKELQESRKP